MTPIEKFLSLFTRIRPGEGRGILLLGLNGFLLVSAYYILKTLRESLILTEFDAETKSYAVAVIAIVLFFVVPLYGVLFRNTNRTQLVVVINAFFIVNLVIFYVMKQSGISIAFEYYVWIGNGNTRLTCEEKTMFDRRQLMARGTAIVPMFASCGYAHMYCTP